MVKKLVKAVRSNFTPREVNPEPGYNEPFFQLEGYTTEGAMSKCVYLTALHGREFSFDLGPNPSAAELAGQIYYKPPESLIDALPLFGDPFSEQELSDHKNELIDHLRRQAAISGISSSFELPEDWFEFLRLKRELRGPGLPAFNNHWHVVHISSLGTSYDAGQMPCLKSAIEELCWDVSLQWWIGGEEQEDYVFYVYARPKGSDQTFRWQVLQYRQYECFVFNTLAEYVHKTSARLETEYADPSFWKTCLPYCGDFTDYW
jgi:hypothetical protein